MNTIHIESGSLEEGNWVEKLGSLGHRFAIITHENIARLYGDKLLQRLKNTELITFPSGEEHKTRETKAKLEDQLLEKKYGRDSCMIALGGGVVTDLAGYLAATFCRGVPFIAIPTSLLGMVDASMGGKTGVNTPFGKNLVGAIYQPKMVIIDPNTLNTLPAKNIREGIVEMIKHGLMADAAYFNFLEENSAPLLALKPNILEKAIRGSCKIKTSIVEQDEKETGKRRLLNLGHTVGHAIETLSNYSISHGEAVALGLLIEGHIAMQLGHIAPDALHRIHHILKLYGLPLQFPPNISPDKLLNAMILDKKSAKGKPRFVILNNIGSALSFDSAYCTHVDEALIKNAILNAQSK